MKLHLLFLLSVFVLCQSSPKLENKTTIEFRRKPYHGRYGPKNFTDDVIKYEIGDSLNFTCYGENAPSRSNWHLMQIKDTFNASRRKKTPLIERTRNYYYWSLDTFCLNESDDGTIIYCRIESKKNNTTYDSATSKPVRLLLKNSNLSNDNGAIKKHSQTKTSPVEKEANSSTHNGIEPAYFALGFSTILVVIVICFLRRYQKSDQSQLLLSPSHPLRVTSYHQYETIDEISYSELHQQRDSNLNCKISMECHPNNFKTSYDNVTETLKMTVTKTIVDVDIENSLYAKEQDINGTKNTFYTNENTV